MFPCSMVYIATARSVNGKARNGLYRKPAHNKTISTVHCSARKGQVIVERGEQEAPVSVCRRHLLDSIFCRERSVHISHMDTFDGWLVVSWKHKRQHFSSCLCLRKQNWRKQRWVRLRGEPFVKAKQKHERVSFFGWPSSGF